MTLIEKQIKTERRVKTAAFLGVLFFTAFILIKVENLLLSFILAFTLTYLLDPLVNYLERNGYKRVSAIGILFALISFIITIVILVIAPVISTQVASLKSEIPKYTKGTIDLIQDIETRLIFISDFFENFDVSEQAEAYLQSFTKSLFEDIPLLLSSSITTMILTPFFAFFMLKDGRKISKLVCSLVPNNYFELFLNLRYQVNDQMGGFIRARFLEAGIVGLVIWVGLWIAHFPYAMILALFAALTNLIPYFGPIIGVIPAFIIALINGYSTFDLFIISLPYLVAQVIDIFVIIPLVVAKIVDLHPISVVISFIIGAQLLGVLGMIIAIPIASALKVTLFTFYRHLVD